MYIVDESSVGMQAVQMSVVAGPAPFSLADDIRVIPLCPVFHDIVHDLSSRQSLPDVARSSEVTIPHGEVDGLL
jgi:hypothetical protein